MPQERRRRVDKQTSVIDYRVKRSHDEGHLQSTVRLFGRPYGGRISEYRMMDVIVPSSVDGANA